MKLKVKTFLSRTSLYTIIVVMALFAVLPLSQKLLEIVDEDMLVVRRVDVAPLPPPPPQEREDADPGVISQAGVNLKSIIPAVNLDPIATGANPNISESLELGLNEIDLDINSNATFTMKGVGFGAAGLDSPPIMVVRPTLRYGDMERKGISQLEFIVLVKWLKDGSLTFIAIEEVEYPDAEFKVMIRDAISQIRYTRPTVDGVPVERFLRLPLTIHAN